MISLQWYAHVRTAVLSYHVQNFVAIGPLDFGWLSKDFHYIWVVMKKS